MPSVQSYFIRVFLSILSARMNSISSIPKLRTFLGAGAKTTGLPRGVTIQPLLADEVPVEWIIPAGVSTQTVILYFHGGGWTLGWYNNHREMVANICMAAAARALAVDYRLAPENPFPAALQDCLSVYRWLIKNGTSPQQIVIAGDSAGGNLTLSTLMALRDAGDALPAAAVCISPVTDLACTGESFTTNKDAMLSPRFVRTMLQHYVANTDPCLPLISPLYGEMGGLPPLLIQVGEDEILLSDATRLADKARAAGVQVNLVVWPNMWHVWHLFAPYLPEAQHAIAAIGDFIIGIINLKIAAGNDVLYTNS
jgi:monoterpene epsilon-lactone hydrolase